MTAWRMSYKSIYPNYVWFFDEGDRRKNGFVVKAFSRTDYRGICSWMARKMVLTPYIFPILILLIKGESLVLASLHQGRISKLDECVNVVLSVRRDDIVTCWFMSPTNFCVRATFCSGSEADGVPGGHNGRDGVPKWLEKVETVLIQA